MNKKLAQTILDSIVRHENNDTSYLCPLCKVYIQLIPNASCFEKGCPANSSAARNLGHHNCLDRPIELGYKLLANAGWTWEYVEVEEK